MDEHTPTPWKVGQAKADWRADTDAGYASYSWSTISAAKGKRRDPVCLVVQADKKSYGDGDAEQDANAAFIVRAANAHDALVEAIKPLALSQVGNPPPGVDEGDWNGAVLAARAALKLARGEQS